MIKKLSVAHKTSDVGTNSNNEVRMLKRIFPSRVPAGT